MGKECGGKGKTCVNMEQTAIKKDGVPRQASGGGQTEPTKTRQPERPEIKPTNPPVIMSTQSTTTKVGRLPYPRPFG